MNYRNFFLKIAAFFLFSLVVGACTQTPNVSLRTTPTTSQLTTTVNVTPIPSPSLPPTPTPPPLGPVPKNCSPGPTPQPLFSNLGPVLGGGRVWFNGIDGPHAVIRFSPSYGYTFPYGWTRKLLWEVGPDYTGTVTLTGENLMTHQSLWFQIGEQAPTHSPVLDPKYPGHPASTIGPGWAEWGSYLFVPTAGCYVLEASWQGGHWQIYFAAGS